MAVELFILIHVEIFKCEESPGIARAVNIATREEVMKSRNFEIIEAGST